MSDLNLKLHEILAETEKNFEVIRSDEFTLLLDIDSPADDIVMANNLKVLQDRLPNFNFQVTGEWVSKSGKGHHVVITSGTRMSMLEKLLLQACLGSDRKRELLALVRYENGVDDTDVSVLFKPKVAVLSAANEEMF